MSDSLHGSLATEYRRQLLLLNRERIEFAYVKAQANALDDPVILVLDLQDDSAVRLAQLTGLPWEQIEQCERPDVVPTQVVAVPRGAVLCLVGPTTPNRPKGVAQPNPPGTFRVVAIASNGNSFADFPLPPESSVDHG
jgi:hypothetical protein